MGICGANECELSWANCVARQCCAVYGRTWNVEEWVGASEIDTSDLLIVFDHQGRQTLRDGNSALAEVKVV